MLSVPGPLVHAAVKKVWILASVLILNRKFGLNWISGLVCWYLDIWILVKHLVSDLNSLFPKHSLNLL